MMENGLVLFICESEATRWMGVFDRADLRKIEEKYGCAHSYRVGGAHHFYANHDLSIKTLSCFSVCLQY